MVGSVVLTVDGGPPLVLPDWPYAPGARRVKDSSRSPVFGFAPMTLSPGRHTLTATPRTGRDGTGQPGQTLTLNFTVR